MIQMMVHITDGDVSMLDSLLDVNGFERWCHEKKTISDYLMLVNDEAMLFEAELPMNA